MIAESLGPNCQTEMCFCILSGDMLLKAAQNFKYFSMHFIFKCSAYFFFLTLTINLFSSVTPYFSRSLILLFLNGNIFMYHIQLSFFESLIVQINQVIKTRWLLVFIHKDQLCTLHRFLPFSLHSSWCLHNRNVKPTVNADNLNLKAENAWRSLD